MSSITRLNLFLLVIIIILAALKFLPKDNEYYPLTAIKAENIQSISISSQQRQLVFNRNEAQWILASMPGQELEYKTIAKLLGILKTHSYRQFENNQNNRSAFGLNTPPYQLKLDKLTIQFGTTEPVQELRYILIDDTIHLINDMYLQFFLADEKFFFRKTSTE